MKHLRRNILLLIDGMLLVAQAILGNIVANQLQDTLGIWSSYVLPAFLLITLELQATVPDYQIPFIAIIQQGQRPFSMFSDLPKYPWVLTPVIEYASVELLLQGFKQGIIDRAWAMHQELVKQKNKALETQSIEDFVREDVG